MSSQTVTTGAPSKQRHKPGDRFGELAITERLPAANGSQYVMCVCDCGTQRPYNLSNLISGATVRCSDRDAHPDPRSKGAAITYNGAHSRVKRARGSASQHLCLCGKPAVQWAYLHADPDERADIAGREAGRPYSADPAHYGPKCRACHNLWDAAERRLTEHHGDRLSLVHHALWVVSQADE